MYPELTSGCETRVAEQRATTGNHTQPLHLPLHLPLHAFSSTAIPFKPSSGASPSSTYGQHFLRWMDYHFVATIDSYVSKKSEKFCWIATSSFYNCQTKSYLGTIITTTTTNKIITFRDLSRRTRYFRYYRRSILSFVKTIIASK